MPHIPSSHLDDIQYGGSELTNMAAYKVQDASLTPMGTCGVRFSPTPPNNTESGSEKWGLF